MGGGLGGGQKSQKVSLSLDSSGALFRAGHAAVMLRGTAGWWPGGSGRCRRKRTVQARRAKPTHTITRRRPHAVHFQVSPQTPHTTHTHTRFLATN